MRVIVVVMLWASLLCLLWFFVVVTFEDTTRPIMTNATIGADGVTWQFTFDEPENRRGGNTWLH